MDMERNPACPSVLEWENLAINNHNNSKATEITQQIGFPAVPSAGSSSMFGNAVRDGFGTGLRLGPQREYENGIPNVLVSAGPAKRSRVTYQNMQSPCCQVEGCNLDLKSAKDYHRRHRICESHSKSPKVIVSGMERRFCQQCSRFHDLSEFDDKKRSCRRRLSDHNARRRRVPPESIQLGSADLSSKLYDQRHQKNLLLNGLPISLSNPTWENANNTSMFGQAAIVRPSRLDGPLCFSGDEMHKSIFQLHMDLDKLSPMHSSSPAVLDQCLLIPTTSSQMAPNLLNAHSPLSSNSWSLNEGEPTSMEDGLVQGNYTHPIMRKSNSEPQNLSLYQSLSGNIPVEQGPGVTMVHSVNHQQEYQLFRASYDSNGFCSSHKNL